METDRNANDIQPAVPTPDKSLSVGMPLYPLSRPSGRASFADSCSTSRPNKTFGNNPTSRPSCFGNSSV